MPPRVFFTATSFFATPSFWASPASSEAWLTKVTDEFVRSFPKAANIGR